MEEDALDFEDTAEVFKDAKASLSKSSAANNLKYDLTEIIIRDLGGKSIYTYMLDHIKSRGIQYVDLFFPYYISSVFAHIANLVNTSSCSRCETPCERRDLAGSPFYHELGKPANLRLHLLMVAPRGFMKNVVLDTFIDEDVGLLTGVVPCTMENILTEAAYIGSFDDKTKEEIPGLAKEYCSGIVAFEEFFSVSMAGKQQHSGQMENVLLPALDSGRLRKRLKSGVIRDYTNHTLWSGTQSGFRQDQSSGMLRRLAPLTFLPSESHINVLIDAHYKTDLTINRNALEIIRKTTQWFWKNFTIDGLQFSGEYMEFVEKNVKLHFVMTTVDKLAIGYTIAHRWRGESILKVELDETLKALILRLLKNIEKIGGEDLVDYEVILKVLNKNVMSLTTLLRTAERNSGETYSILGKKAHQLIYDGALIEIKVGNPKKKVRKKSTLVFNPAMITYAEVQNFVTLHYGEQTIREFEE